jgi:hypothetical protein
MLLPELDVPWIGGAYGSCVAPLLRYTRRTEWLEIPIPLCNKMGLSSVLDVQKAAQRACRVCLYTWSTPV